MATQTNVNLAPLPVVDLDLGTVSVDFEPVLPYAGTSGHSGTDTSPERARQEDSTGITGLRQRRTLRLVQAAGLGGVTWREVADVTGLHHGQVSGALTNLHHAGHIVRLADRRGRCKVYVHPDYVGGRTTEAYRRRGAPGPLDAEVLREARGLAWDEGFKAAAAYAGAPSIPNPYGEAGPDSHEWLGADR
jgi:hypothetical protein